MGEGQDPRLTGEYVREVSGPAGAVTLVGVVHDHPASCHRVRHHVRRLDPEVLALELPPTAVPLFEEYATSSRSPPPFGGEMSTAVQATTDATVVGVDRPTGSFCLRLARTLIRDRPSWTAVREVLRNTGSAARHALVCRVAASVATHTSLRVEVDDPTRHPTDRTDSPAAQADDERTQVRRSRTFANAFRTDSRSRATELEDATREAHMAERLVELGDEGAVVAVVGIDHLDSLVGLLEDAVDDSAGTSG